MTVILASKSAARRAILSGAGVVHEAAVAGVDELGDGICQHRALEFEKGEFDREVRTGRSDTRGDRAEGFSPFRITCTVRE